VNLRVHYDEQIFILQEFGGISRYFTELIREFRKHPELGIDPVLKHLNYPNRYISDLLGKSRSTKKSKIRRYLSLLANTCRTSGSGWQMRHNTFYARVIRKNAEHISVITLYDMIPERSGSGLINAHLLKRFVLPRADLVLSISDTAAVEFEEYSNKPLKHLTVTPLGVSDSFSPDAPRLSSLPERYLLFVGGRAGYKRGAWAISLLRELTQEINLVFVGPNLTGEEKAEVKRLGLESRVFNYQPNDEELPSFYAHAMGLLHLSRMEGFGLPILEGLRSEIPVILPKNSINLEVAQSHGCFFEEDNFDELVKEVRETLAGKNWTHETLLAGAQYAKKFTWYECARLTAGAYHSAVERKNAKK
jgi:glycosyltransferase involved in cell wall biosynthesis